MSPQSQNPKIPSPDKRRSIFWFVAALVFLVVTILYFRKPAHPLTTDLLEEAIQRWENSGVSQYLLALQVTGANEGLHKITVSNRKVVGMTIDGAPVPEHVWVYWNVEGMFQFMADELLRREKPKAAYGVENEKQVLLRVKFNARHGYPERFMRHVHNQNIGVAWEVLSFDIPEGK